MTRLTAKEDHLQAIPRLSRIVEDTLRPLIAPGEHCALLDFPSHANVGDSAIWSGAVGCLKKLGAVIAYTSDISNHSNGHLSKRLSSGAILLNGGGNFGDIWPVHQKFREMIVEKFPSHRIVQLSQSIYFEDTENVRRAKKIFNQHTDLTLLVRDHESFNFAKNEFKCQIFLCPDMAFALGSLSRETDPRKRGLALLRSDCESALSHFEIPVEFDRADWLKDDFHLMLSIYKKTLWLRTKFPNRLRNVSFLLSKFYDRIARVRLTRGCNLLSKYRYVVTDRLHGHILCVLLGIRHVCLDNSNGKLRNFYETWTCSLDSAHWSESLDEALKGAQSPSDK